MIPDLPSAVVARLKANCDALRDVGGAAGLDSIDEQLATVPAAFAIPLAERPTDPPTAAQFSQLIDVAVGVVYVVESVSAAADDISELIALRRAAFAALLSWSPADCLSGLAYAGGRLVRLSNNLLWWQDDFITTYLEVRT